MDRIKVGIIGAGYIGGVHARLLARDERVVVSAVHDVDSERSERLARTVGAVTAYDAEQLINGVEAVYITTPNTKHTELALAAIEADKHVFCEKPMATTVDDAKAILDRASASPRVPVGHNRRFAPVYACLKRW